MKHAAMRIGIDARFYGSLGKGLGRYTEKLIQELERLPGEDEFVVFLRRENFDEYQPAHSRFTKVLADFPWYGWREQLLFPRLLSRSRLDLVHFPHFNVPLFARGPFVVTIHDLILFHYPTVKASELPPFLYWMKYLVYRLVIAVALSRAVRVMTVSQFTADDIVSHFPSACDKIRVAPESAEGYCTWMSVTEAAQTMVRYGLSKRSYVLYVGNAYPHKNLELLLTAAYRLPEKDFVCVGRADYFYARLKREATSRKLANVRFVGFVPDRELTVLYRYAESYFFPSLYEGFGLPALEAFIHGTPVVAAHRGALPEILGGAASFFDPAEPRQALAALSSVAREHPVRQALIAQGYTQASRYSWRRMAEHTLREYHESIAYERYP